MIFNVGDASNAAKVVFPAAYAGCRNQADRAAQFYTKNAKRARPIAVPSAAWQNCLKRPLVLPADK